VLGSIAIGFLVSVSLSGLVAFCRAAIPLIWVVRGHTRPAEHQDPAAA